MNRDRYKYRVWDKEHKEYVGVDYKESQHLNDELYGDYYLILSSGPYDLSEDENFILEQCIGIKDTEGRLIYEGDYVECGYYTYEVCWDDYDCSFYGRDISDYESPDIGFHLGQELRIVGNRNE